MTTSTFVFDPYDPSTIDDPFPAYRVLRDEHPLYRNAERDFWSVARAEDVTALSRDWETFSSAQGMDLDCVGRLFGPGNILSMDPPSHDQLRKLARDGFSAKRIVELEPVVRQKVNALVDQFAERGAADLAEELTTPLPVSVVSHILGVPETDEEMVGVWVHAILRRVPGDPEIPREAHEGIRRLAGYFKELAAKRRARPQEDTLSAIVCRDIDGALLPDEMVLGLCLTTFSAGSETVQNFASSSLALLEGYPELRADFFADPDGMPIAIEELLRFETPVQNVVRTTTRPVELYGMVIPADSRILLLHGSANRDERVWEHADRLDLKRRPKRHLAFGEGIHFCLGAPLARLQARIIFEVVGARIPEYEVVGPITRVARVNSRGVESLPVEFSPC